MIAKTEAIPIRISPFGGTSHIVTWITPEYGKISTVIKGAQRPKRMGGGQYDIGYICELLFYEREFNGLHTFKECVALDARTSMRGQWRKTALTSYLCLLTGNASLPFLQMPILYQNLLYALDALEDSTRLAMIMIWFECQLLSLHGTTPQLQRCTVCRQHATEEPILLSPQAGGLICPACNAKRRLQTHTIRMHTLQTLQLLQRTQTPEPFADSEQYELIPDEGIEAMGSIMTQWMDIAPHARNLTLQMIRLQLNHS